MATLGIRFLASSVQMQMRLQVFLPEAALSADAGPRLRVLWLLHGERGDCTDWLRLSMVEHRANDANLALVMPSMDNSMYMDMAHGGYPYFRYLAEDLPGHVRHQVRVLSPRREDNFVAGVGVGGYGAVKWALREPGMFAACACLSGELDIVSALSRRQARGMLGDEWIAAFGDPQRVARSEDDNLRLIDDRVRERVPLPAFYVGDGVDDEGRQRNREAADQFARQGASVTVRDADGASGWPLWDRALADFIRDAVTPEG